MLLSANAAVVRVVVGLMVTAAVATTPFVKRLEFSPNKTQSTAEPLLLQVSVLPAAVAAADAVNVIELTPAPGVSRH
jgi:hypothetical protein